MSTLRLSHELPPSDAVALKTCLVNNLFMTTPLERMYQVMEEIGADEAELARRTENSPQTVNNWGRRKNLPEKQAPRVAEALGITLDWLMYGREPKHPYYLDADEISELSRETGNREQRPHRAINIYPEVTINEGGSADLPSPVGQLILDEYSAPHIGPNAFAVPVSGEAMLPDFKPDDLVVIDPDAEPSPGKYVYAVVEGQSVLRKYREKSKDIIELAPLNDDYPTLTIHGDNDGKILGKAVHHRRNIG